MSYLLSDLGLFCFCFCFLFWICSALSWEGGGLRLALAVDAYIYLANIRPEYKWGFFGNSTCVYGFKKKDHTDHSVMFWDIGTGERYMSQVSLQQT